MIVKVLEVLEYTKHTNGYSVIVKAINPMGNIFTYQFIKNLKSDADKIVTDFEWEFKSNRKWIKI